MLQRDADRVEQLCAQQQAKRVDLLLKAEGSTESGEVLSVRRVCFLSAAAAALNMNIRTYEYP